MSVVTEQINSMGSLFVGFAVPMLVQSSVLIAVLLFVDSAVRKKVRAAFRHWMWMAALAHLVLPSLLLWPKGLVYWVNGKGAYEEVEWGAAAAQAGIWRVTSVTWQGGLLLVWLAVAGSMVLLLVERTILARRLVAGARDANYLMNGVLWYCCQCMRVKRRVRLKVSARVTSPVVCGLFRPLILVPHNLAPSLGSRHLRSVLLHELGHVKRGDLWVNLAQTVLQIIYFYNPLLWLANSRIRGVREQAADEKVIFSMGEKAFWYPEALVDVSNLASKRPALSLDMIGVV
jgi:beta-lactamase regulating signal transducer with metallopeptidase domain